MLSSICVTNPYHSQLQIFVPSLTFLGVSESKGPRCRILTGRPLTKTENWFHHLCTAFLGMFSVVYHYLQERIIVLLWSSEWVLNIYRAARVCCYGSPPESAFWSSQSNFQLAESTRKEERRGKIGRSRRISVCRCRLTNVKIILT